MMRFLYWLCGCSIDATTSREPQLIGGRWDGLSERDAGQLVHRIMADADTCWLEIVDPISGKGDRYEQFGQDWFWAGRLKQKV